MPIDNPVFLSDIVGSIAAILTTLCYVPQVWLVVKKRQTQGISLLMYITFTLGVSLWLVYGLLLGSVPIIAANTVTLCLAIIIVTMKIRLG